MLTYDDTKHEYRVDGMVVPSVTQILKCAGLIDARWYTDEAAIRGTYLAEATALDDRGELDESSLAQVLVPYVEAWRKFRRECGWEVERIEWAVSSPRGYAGRIDRTFVDAAGRIVADLKTGHPEPWHGVQLAGYAACCAANRRLGIYLTDEAKYNVVEYDNYDDFEVFSAALAITGWRMKNGWKPAD